jgi:AGCS family alanine or glycine:cation symporter
MFVAFMVIASVTSASNLLDFSDLLILAMAFPNFIALYVLHGKVSLALKEYRKKMQNGELDRELAHP